MLTSGPTVLVSGRTISYPRNPEGEAEQPPLIYLASLDAMFTDMRAAGVALENIVAINTSGQQHGHVYLNKNAGIILSNLQRAESCTLELKTLLGGIFSYYSSPIWMTADTLTQTKPCESSSRWKSGDD